VEIHAINGAPYTSTRQGFESLNGSERQAILSGMLGYRLRNRVVRATGEAGSMGAIEF
jgi:hypothetical protein